MTYSCQCLRQSFSTRRMCSPVPEQYPSRPVLSACVCNGVLVPVQTAATLEHVEMAIELFRRSTMDAVKSGVATYNVASDPQVCAMLQLLHPPRPP